MVRVSGTVQNLLPKCDTLFCKQIFWRTSFWPTMTLKQAWRERGTQSWLHVSFITPAGGINKKKPFTHTRVARWSVLKPKIPIWVNFVGPQNGKCWYILCSLGVVYSHLVYFGNVVVLWYIFPRFGILCQEKSGNPDSHRQCFHTIVENECFENHWYVWCTYIPNNKNVTLVKKIAKDVSI
jgi:hypothetical protein